MPGFPTQNVGTPTHRGKARRYTDRNSEISAGILNKSEDVYT
jgi:hypothetical protein